MRFWKLKHFSKYAKSQLTLTLFYLNRLQNKINLVTIKNNFKLISYEYNEGFDSLIFCIKINSRNFKWKSY